MPTCCCECAALRRLVTHWVRICLKVVLKLESSIACTTDAPSAALSVVVCVIMPPMLWLMLRIVASSCAAGVSKDAWLLKMSEQLLI